MTSTSNSSMGNSLPEGYPPHKKRKLNHHIKNRTFRFVLGSKTFQIDVPIDHWKKAIQLKQSQELVIVCWLATIYPCMKGCGMRLFIETINSHFRSNGIQMDEKIAQNIFKNKTRNYDSKYRYSVKKRFNVTIRDVSDQTNKHF
eukprot:95211_1